MRPLLRQPLMAGKMLVGSAGPGGSKPWSSRLSVLSGGGCVVDSGAARGCDTDLGIRSLLSRKLAATIPPSKAGHGQRVWVRP